MTLNTTFSDASGRIRLEGSLGAPGATVGDVLTVQSDESIAPATPAVSGVSSVTDGSTTVDPATSIDFTSGATVTDGGAGVAQVAVGGSQPACEWVVGNPTAIGNAAASAIPWNTKVDGSDLLDLGTPNAPAVATAGYYIVSVSVLADALTAGGRFTVNLSLDNDNVGANLSVDASAPAIRASVTVAYLIPQDGTIQAYITNDDGVAARNFSLAATVVRIA